MTVTARARRIQGPVERAARADIRALPDQYRTCAVAVGYILLARRLDAGMPAREAITGLRELRMAFLTLDELAPRRRADDYVDEVQKQREKRMAEIHAGG